jgi:hypothetical protein
MKTVQLPHGGKAWFVRKRRGRHCGLAPASVEGHLLTAGYAAVVGAIAWFFARRGEIGAPLLGAMIVLMLALTFLYILTAWRMSAPAPTEPKGRDQCS